MQLTDIEQLTRKFSTAREELEDVLRGIAEQKADIDRAWEKRVAKLVKLAHARRAALQTAIADAPELFVTPRTYIFREIEVGLEKGSGRIVVPDETKSIELVKSKLTNLKKMLIHQKETLVKKALRKLKAAQLALIGCRLEGTEDQVVIRPIGDAGDQVEALLAAAAVEQEKN